MFNATTRTFTLEDASGSYDWIVEGADPAEVATMTDEEMGTWVDTLIENSKEQDRYEIEERAASKSYPCHGYTTAETFESEDEYIAARTADMEEDYKVERGEVINWIKEWAREELKEADMVVNQAGARINFVSAVTYMDDEIREVLHNQQEWESNQEFFSAYERAHREQRGEEWGLSKANPVW